jgi:hypothetical protein
MPSYMDTLPRLLIGAVSLDEAARDLRLAVPELRQLLQRSSVDTAVLAPSAFDVADAEMELIDVAGCAFDEAFFEASMQRQLLADGSRVRVRAAALDVLRGARQYSQPPSALIFHTGRCGSTLLANLLSVVTDAVLLKEPPVISDLAAARLRAETEEARRWVEEILEATCRYLCGAVGRSSGRAFRVIKLAAWNVGVAHVLLRYFPDTPAVFLFRDPAEVVSSLLFQPPAWHPLLERTAQGQAAFFPSTREEGAGGAGSALALFAHAWRSAVEAALALPRERVLFVDYAALVKSPLAELEGVLAHLRRPKPAELETQLASESRKYSKDASVPFDPAGRHRRPKLSEDELRALERIVGSLPAQLAERVSGIAGGAAA